MTKFIFITGGVVSGLGKGITAASLGRLLKQRGFKPSVLKLDPYMNVDPGTMSPFEHGEVFVTEDGAETDLDLGHYERFIDENLNKHSNLTSGRVYWNVLSREREGGYLGKTVQVIPHITEEIKNFIYSGAEETNCDVLITEIGGTIGDIESQPFLEAIRQVFLEQGPQNCLFIHVTLVPYLSGSAEHKSKPTQHSVRELRASGISPNIIVCRVDKPLEIGIKDKIALFCNVKPDCVIENQTVSNLYEIPLYLHNEGLDKVACRELGLTSPEPNLEDWEAMVDHIHAREGKVNIALVGKYIQLHDAYLSVSESLQHASFANGVHVKIHWIDSELISDETAEKHLGAMDGILIPGGFGNRGIEGKIAACRYAREQNIPYLGLCLGMQIAVIEFARTVCHKAAANSVEFDPETEHPVIHYMPGQSDELDKGGTMRLGAWPCHVKENTLLHSLYEESEISERHRHRLEFNNDYREELEGNGLKISGVSPDNRLVECVEIPDHPYFVGVQFHPEFKSRPDRPHPLFVGLLENARKRAEALAESE